MSLEFKTLWLSMVVITAMILAGCSQVLEPIDSIAEVGDVELQELMARPPHVPGPPPMPLETVTFGSQSLTFWPFTGNDFSGNGRDPINLIFVGQADPRDIRAALLSLDGDRTAYGFPDAPPFNARWDDAIGEVQAGYSDPNGWAPGCVQLACGDYGPVRFHLRLFDLGDWTFSSVHFEILIPGTTDHQVISWEVAEQFVIVDFLRSGLLDEAAPMMPTGQINPAGWRTIPAIIYNGLPVELRALIGGPLADVSEDVPIGSDGMAIIFNLAGKADRVSETRVQDFILDFNQAVPRPFCASGPADYVFVQGPVHLVQTTTLNDAGVYHSTFRAEGELFVTPIDPFTGNPIGETLMAEVAEHHDAHLADNTEWASFMLSQQLLPDTASGAGRLFIRFNVRSDGQNGYDASVRCADNPWEEVAESDPPSAMQDPTIAPAGDYMGKGDR